MSELPSTRLSLPTWRRPRSGLGSPGGGMGSTKGLSTAVDIASTTIGLDRPFAVKDHIGTVARPLLVSTSTVFKEALVIVSRHFDTGTDTCPQLSYVVPIAAVSAGRGSRTLTERVDPSLKSMRAVPRDAARTPGAMVTCPAPHAAFCSIVSKPSPGVRDEYRKTPSGGFGIPAARTACATARARLRNAGVTGPSGICDLTASRGTVGRVAGVALLAPEAGATSFPHAANVRTARTTAGTKYLQHLERLMRTILNRRSSPTNRWVPESCAHPGKISYPRRTDSR
ncbi:hypothetical protein BJY22_001437 [Kribbella shirazensis]|uniref:Uncharacterized protein n=1 Tax=Kribbella shirazensis TaxID=1105143 RepID=A0A7X5V6W7_9ACTN|nr:hypothetical protein [Kribbella shirazensis]